MKRIWSGALLGRPWRGDAAAKCAVGREFPSRPLGTPRICHISPGTAPKTLTCTHNSSGGTESIWRTSQMSTVANNLSHWETHTRKHTHTRAHRDSNLASEQSRMLFSLGQSRVRDILGPVLRGIISKNLDKMYKARAENSKVKSSG